MVPTETVVYVLCMLILKSGHNNIGNASFFGCLKLELTDVVYNALSSYLETYISKYNEELTVGCDVTCTFESKVGHYYSPTSPLLQ
jgi:hypothetical protein